MSPKNNINLLTLLAIVLSVGLVVDDAIVVVENVERYLHLGLTPFDAAMKGARELLGPIIAMTITLAAVYAPIGIQGGLTGTLFREFAFTLAGAVVVYGVVAVTISPMMSSKLLREGDSHRGYAGWINHRFEALRQSYMRVLTNTLKYRPVTFSLWVIICLVLGPLLLMFSTSELAPKEDQGVVFGIVMAGANATVDQNSLFTEKVYETFKAFPEMAHTFQLTMPTGGFSGLVTKAWSQRKRSTLQMEEAVRTKAASIAGVNVIVTTPAPLPGGGTFPVDFAIASTAEPEQLLEFAETIARRAAEKHILVFIKK